MPVLIYKKWIAIGIVCSLLAGCAGNSFHRPSSSERNRELSNIKTQLALEFMRGRDYRQAVSSIEEAVRTDSRNLNAWLMRAQIYQYLKVRDKTEESYQAALTLNPNSAEANNNYGWFICDLLNKPKDSIRYFDKALSDPTYPTPQVAYLNQGICSAKMGQYRVAEGYFERALSVDPKFLVVRKEMARAYLLEKQLNRANDLFRFYSRYIDVLSADDLLLGWKIAKALGNNQAASEYQQQLQQNYPYSNEWQQTLGSQ